MKKLIPMGFRLLSRICPNCAAHLALKIFLRPRAKPRTAEELDFLVTGQRHTFASGRVAHSWGKGPVVLLLHGWESQGSTFYKLIPRLVESGYRAVAWDAPAHGQSPGKRTNVPDYAISLAQDLNQQLFDPPVALLGHSFGGASMSILSKIHDMPPKLVIVSAPTKVADVFDHFAKMIGLGHKANQRFIQLAESTAGYSLGECSLINNDLSVERDVMVSHDRVDDLIPYADF